MGTRELSMAPTTPRNLIRLSQELRLMMPYLRGMKELRDQRFGGEEVRKRMKPSVWSWKMKKSK